MKIVVSDVLLLLDCGRDVVGELDVGEDGVFVGVLDMRIKCGWFWVEVVGWKWICFFWFVWWVCFIVLDVKCCIMKFLVL